jgi:hypothetical protein
LECGLLVQKSTANPSGYIFGKGMRGVGGGVSGLNIILKKYLEKHHATIGIRQRDADSGLGSSGTLEPAEKKEDIRNGLITY